MSTNTFSFLKTGIKKILFALPIGKWLYSKYFELLAIVKWRKLENSKGIMLELGSGPQKGKNGWTTVDLYRADINYDLRNGIPLKDSCVDAIYTSHMFEHIPYKALIIFIAECKRILKSGGYLSVCVPNAGLYIQAYVNGNNFGESSSFYQPALVETGSFLDQVNYIAYMDGQHAYLFDKENLVNTIKKGGFSKVSLRDFDPCIDLAQRDCESIYAIAYKQ